MIRWVCAADPRQHLSGGVRKIGDLHEIIAARGFSSELWFRNAPADWRSDDLAIVPEVFGDGLRDIVPAHVPVVSFAQNGYLIEVACNRTAPHPYVSTPNLVAVMTESDNTSELVRIRCPDLKVPIARTHSSGNGRMGQTAGFSYGPWPREKRVIYFDYKHEAVNGQVFDNLLLPDGWQAMSLTGRSDAEIMSLMATSAIFAATNVVEGMCAPTSEAMISGCAIVTWPGGPSQYGFSWMPSPPWAPNPPHNTTVGGPMEYLAGRAKIVIQDDITGLRRAIEAVARHIDNDPAPWAKATARYSEWFQTEYSRQGEIDEICGLMEGWHGRR